ncbi:MAG: oligosaccharide flippase family protein, partial [Pseudomonadota bacterium]
MEIRAGELSRFSSISRDLVIAVLGQGFEKLIAFVVIAVLVRYFDQTQIGQFFLAISVTSIVAALTELGTSSHLVRAVARQTEQAGAHVSRVLYLRLPLSAAATVAVCAGAALLVPEQFGIYALVSVYVLGSDLYYAFGAALTGLRRVAERVISGLIGPAVLLLLVPLAAAGGLTLGAVLMIYAASSVVMLLAAWRIVLRHTGPLAGAPGVEALRDTLKGALPMFAMALLAPVFEALGWIHDPYEQELSSRLMNPFWHQAKVS